MKKLLAIAVILFLAIEIKRYSLREDRTWNTYEGEISSYQVIIEEISDGNDRYGLYVCLVPKGNHFYYTSTYLSRARYDDYWNETYRCQHPFVRSYVNPFNPKQMGSLCGDKDKADYPQTEMILARAKMEEARRIIKNPAHLTRSTHFDTH